MRSIRIAVVSLVAVCVLPASGSGNAWTQAQDREVACRIQDGLGYPAGNQDLAETSRISLAQTCTADCLAKYRDCLNRGGSSTSCWDSLQECLKDC